MTGRQVRRYQGEARKGGMCGEGSLNPRIRALFSCKRAKGELSGVCMMWVRRLAAIWAGVGPAQRPRAVIGEERDEPEREPTVTMWRLRTAESHRNPGSRIGTHRLSSVLAGRGDETPDP